MRLVTLERENYSEPGVWWNDEIIGLRGAGFTNMLQVVAGGADSLDRVERWIYNPPAGERLDPERTTLLSPIPRPPKLICIGLNYRDHAAESKSAIPEVPTVFSKFHTAVTGHRHPIVLPKDTTKPDYEAEFAVVIGKGGRRIPEASWREHVFGYTIVNDVSARDVQAATSQWMLSKTFDTFAPIGPAIVTADEIEDPHTLDSTRWKQGSHYRAADRSCYWRASLGRPLRRFAGRRIRASRQGRGRRRRGHRACTASRGNPSLG